MNEKMMEDLMRNDNPHWHTVAYNEYGRDVELVNTKKQYTLMVNEKTSEYCVAYKLNEYNSWEQGHYFTDFYAALEFMFRPEEV